MVQSGSGSYIDISIYNTSIQMTIHCNYTDNLGRSRFMLEYFTFDYPSRFWRFMFERSLIKSLKKMAIELGLRIGMIYNFKSIEADYSLTSSIKRTRVVDFRNK